MNIFWYLVIGITLTSLAYRVIGIEAVSYREGIALLTSVMAWPAFLLLFIMAWVFVVILFFIYSMAWSIGQIINFLKPSSL